MSRTVNVRTNLTLVIPGKKKDVREVQKKDKVVKIVSLVFLYAILAFLAIIVLVPFYYMIVASMMEEADIKIGSFYPTMGNIFDNIAYNYSQTVNNPQFNYLQLVSNTLIVGFSTTCLGMIITILSAFAFARLKFRGRDLLFTIFLATMMIPGEMMVISNYPTMANLGMISLDQNRMQAYLVMILPFLTSVFYIYLLRQTFKQIPNELYLAAKVDGKSDWSYLWKVMVPLASPTLITIFILNLIGSWNAYVWPKLAVTNSDFYPISVALRSAAFQLEVQPDIFETQSSWTMAATCLTVVPLLLLFIIFRKYIMRGVGRAGIKG